MNSADPHLAKLRALAPVKICGLTTAETVAAALEGKAAYLGFMFFEKSPRNLTVQRAAELAAAGDVKGLAHWDAVRDLIVAFDAGEGTRQ